MILTDTHCHLYAGEFKNDADAVIQRAEAAGVTKFYLPSIDSSETDSLIELENKYPGKCFAMMGLHPCSVKENYKSELMHAESWLRKRRFSAIGEIGLDFYWDTKFTEQQVDAFRIQAGWAIEQDLPISIHSRNAMRETIDIVKEFSIKGLRGVFHCFSGNYENAMEIIGAGFYLGIGGVITYKNSGLAGVIERVGNEHLVLETDAPYLAPAPFRGRRNESSYLHYIVEKLAEIKNTSPEDIAAITTANAERIFSQKN